MNYSVYNTHILGTGQWTMSECTCATILEARTSTEPKYLAEQKTFAILGLLKSEVVDEVLSIGHDEKLDVIIVTVVCSSVSTRRTALRPVRCLRWYRL
jgi:hypothetical protein